MSLIDFVDEVKNLVKEQVNNIHTALPGEIVSIDATTCRASVRPKAQMSFSNGKVLDFPIISGVPVVIPQSPASGAVIAFPVKAGDPCLLIFSEQALDYWFENGTTNSQVKHGLSGAIAILGLMKTPSSDVKDAIEHEDLMVRDGNASLALSIAAISCRGDVTVEGNLLINGEVRQVTG